MQSFKLILAGALLATALPASAAENETPIIEFHTSVYDLTGVSNAFHFTLGTVKTDYYDIDFGFGTTEVEIGPAVYDPESKTIQGTVITGSVNADGVVKIYGDPANIDYIDMEGCYITDISFPQLTEVQIINLDRNELTGLDLSHMHKLESISVSDNSYSAETPLVIGKDKPNLTILSMSIVKHLDPAFSLRDYPSLVTFDAWANYGLTECDPTGCPELMKLTIDATPVESVDVTKNPKLLILNIGDTRISSIDLSANPNLREFYCSNGGSIHTDVKLSELNLGEKKDLVYLFCSYNNLSSLDLSGCPNLFDVACQGNLLTSLDISKNPEIYNLNLSLNYLDFATIPEPRQTFGEYYYFQRPFPMNRSYPVGEEIDFSSKVNRPGSTTTATVYSVSEAEIDAPDVLGSEYYTYSDGKLKFLKAVPDSVYVTFHNTALPASDMETVKFMVKNADEMGKPSPTAVLTFSSSVKEFSMNIGMSGATPESPVKFSVDFGDGELKEFTTDTGAVPMVANVTGTPAGTRRTVTIYAPEGHDLTALALRDAALLRTDFSAARSLDHLEISGCELPRIDLTWNRCLQSLNLSGNTLSTLDLTTEIVGYNKNTLFDIDVSDNRLTDIVLAERRIIRNLNLSNNRLTEFVTQQLSGLLKFDISGNLLTEISLQDFESLTDLNVSDNNISTIYLPEYTPLNSLDISLNDFRFPALPAAGSVPEYTYAPQREVRIPTKSPSANLSSEWLEKDGQTTVYTWRKASDDSVLTDAQVEGDKGYFTFKDASVGEIYCSMTHPAFPALSGADAITTTKVLASEAPVNTFFSMTTLETDSATIILTAKEKNTAIYVDWKGDGDLEQYIVDTGLSIIPVSTTANADVKFYSYAEDEGLTVFSYEGSATGNVNASGMKNLSFFAMYGTKLTPDDIRFPESKDLESIHLNGNRFSSLETLNYPNLRHIGLDNNEFTSLDLSGYPLLETAYAAYNKIESIKLDNPVMWELDLTENNLSAIDLKGVPEMNQLWLAYNHLSAINLSDMPMLSIIDIQFNDFTFATMPVEITGYNNAYYTVQNILQVTPEDGKVDLSSQVSVQGTETEYHWFIGSPYIDENGNLAGEELEDGKDYAVENGVTTFYGTFTKIMCVMTNERFPGFYLLTNFINVKGTSGLENVVDPDDDAPVEYYDLRGVRVTDPAPGIYIRRQGSKVSKVVVK